MRLGHYRNTIILAVLTIIIYAGSVAGNLVADYVKNKLSPYIAVTIFLIALAATVIVAILERQSAGKSVDPPPNSTPPSPTKGDDSKTHSDLIHRVSLEEIKRYDKRVSEIERRAKEESDEVSTHIGDCVFNVVLNSIKLFSRRSFLRPWRDGLGTLALMDGSCANA